MYMYVHIIIILNKITIWDAIRKKVFWFVSTPCGKLDNKSNRIVKYSDYPDITSCIYVQP